ncbi:MAG: hypothetical protein P8R54_12440 [Myxococcota bacterium]|nr:hypothetical protein [Myxococcota bacterium]
MLIFLTLSADAATTVVLPSGEDPADWQAAVSMAGMTLGPATSTPHVTLSIDQLCAVRSPTQQRCVPLALPQTDDAREDAIWLARSLLREFEAAPLPVPAPVPAPAPVAARPTPSALPPAREPVVVAPASVLVPPPEESVVPVAVSPQLRYRSDSGLAIGGVLSVMLPTTQALQPLARLSGIAPDRLSLDGPERQTTQLGGHLGVRWQHDGPTAALDVGVVWQRWRQEGTPIAAALVPQATARLGWRIAPDGPLAWQPWLGTATALRRVSMSIDGDPIAAPARLSGLIGLSVERSGG